MEDFWAGLTFGIVVAVMGMLIVGSMVDHTWKNETVKHGKAEYYINQQTYEEEWRWKD